MKLKVQFVRCKGWSPQIRSVPVSDPHLTLDASATRLTILRPGARCCSHVVRQANFTVVPGRPKDLLHLLQQESK